MIINITPIGHNLWGVEEGSAFAGALRWYGEHMRFTSPEGDHLGDLFRSDGKIQGRQHTADCSQSADDCQCPPAISYTWRAYLHEGDRRGAEVARRASQEDAVAAIITARRTDPRERSTR